MGVNLVGKSTAGEAAQSASRRQGCPPRGGVCRKPATKSRPDGQEPHTRTGRLDELVEPSEIPGRHKDGGLNGAGAGRFALLPREACQISYGELVGRHG